MISASGESVWENELFLLEVWEKIKRNKLNLLGILVKLILYLIIGIVASGSKCLRKKIIIIEK